MIDYKTALIAAAFTVAGALPVAAAELPNPPASKPELAQAAKIIKHRPTRVAAAGWQGVCGRGGSSFPIVIGVAF